MLVNNYKLEILTNQHMPGAMNCFAHLDQDISSALPYLNAILYGFEYIKEPPSVTFRAQGKLMMPGTKGMRLNPIILA